MILSISPAWTTVQNLLPDFLDPSTLPPYILGSLLLLIPIISYPLLPPIRSAPEITLLTITATYQLVQIINTLAYYSPSSSIHPIDFPVWMYPVTSILTAVFHAGVVGVSSQDNNSSSSSSEYIASIYEGLGEAVFVSLLAQLNWHAAKWVYGSGLLSSTPVDSRVIAWLVFGWCCFWMLFGLEVRVWVVGRVVKMFEISVAGMRRARGWGWGAVAATTCDPGELAMSLEKGKKRLGEEEEQRVLPPCFCFRIAVWCLVVLSTGSIVCRLVGMWDIDLSFMHSKFE